MFSHLIAAFLVAFPVLALAQQTCQTGNVTCCNTLTDAQNPIAANLLGGLGIVGDITGLIGLDCDPVGVGVIVPGLAGDSCNGQTVCCKATNFGGIIALGCNPVHVNL